ncbi:uncharacterized protein FA14DRAFT_173875 [Meira miltonrushii]|uniref:mRNA splicing factor n=1 Tax=Meira miltonrushii TaxID=1280837 RepID=A0A316VD56_9BASI|nr:uncharacterized protein FA14DRAFT_173875 [Meira miltonrushii]PWN34173.1 hypothetical protein FA14DRAFT_173875 [Meira miltonrushii]
MEAASVSRKVRLEELRRRKEASSADSNANQVKGDHPRSISEIRFDEEDEKMQDEGTDVEQLRKRVEKWSTAKLIRSFRVLDRKQRVDYTRLKDTIENMIIGIQEGVIAEHEIKREQDLDLHNIAPKRPNWDLKRDLQKRLAKLERRDREARLILIRQRIEAASKSANNNSGEAMAAAAAAGALANSEAMLSTAVGQGSEESDSESD